MTATRKYIMEQRWRAVCIERCKHGSERGLRRPTAEMWQGGTFLLYPIQYSNLNTSYWQSHFYAYGRPPYN